MKKKDNGNETLQKVEQIVTTLVLELRNGIQQSLINQIYGGIKTIDLVSTIKKEALYEFLEDEELEEEAKNIVEVIQKADRKQKEALLKLFSLGKEDIRKPQEALKKVRELLARRRLQAMEILFKQGIPKVNVMEGKVNLKLRVEPKESSPKKTAKGLREAGVAKGFNILAKLPSKSSEDYNCEIEIKFKVDI